MARRNQTSSLMEAHVLDPMECDRARLARDAAYDGRFYTGVRTTGVYCRPVCPVRPAQSRNVRFFPSAGAAEAAGFRPCLRCRPETAPFSPAWNGSRTTVARGLRLIARGALDGVKQRSGRWPHDWASVSGISRGCSRGTLAPARADREDCARAAGEAAARYHGPAGLPGCTGRGVRQSAPMQRGVLRGVGPAADGNPAWATGHHPSGAITFCGFGPSSAARIVSAALTRVSSHACGEKNAACGVMISRPSAHGSRAR